MNQLSTTTPHRPIFEHERIMLDIANQYGVTIADLKGRKQRQPIGKARDHAYHALWKPWERSLPMIGRMFGNRHHTTVLQGIRRHRERAGL